MSNLIAAASFLVLAATLIGVFFKNRAERSTAEQAALIASIISTLVIAVDTFLDEAIPAAIFIPVELLLLSVMVLGILYGYSSRPEHEQQTG